VRVPLDRHGGLALEARRLAQAEEGIGRNECGMNADTCLGFLPIGGCLDPLKSLDLVKA
jgi:hypothetical protein